MKNSEFTPELIERLKPNEIFVFGSNLSGFHAGGAARAAYERFGAMWGVGVGLSGKSYALPTLNESLEKLSFSELVSAFKKFFQTARRFPRLKFYLTKVGMGIAGYKLEDICYPLLESVNINPDVIPSNVVMPREFVEFINKETAR